MKNQYHLHDYVFGVITTVFLMTTLGCGNSEDQRTSLKVMTFNILCSFCDQSYPPFEERLAYFKDIFDRNDPDLIGLQELTWPDEVDKILKLHPGFKAIYYKGSEPGPMGFTDYPDATILFRADRFTLVDKHFFWLSPTPDEPWSAGFAEGGQLPRLAAMAELVDKISGSKILFLTTHVDNNSPSQEKSAPLILERLTPYDKEMPLIVTGDFNSTPTSKAYSILTTGKSENRPGTGLKLIDAFDLALEKKTPTNQDPAPEYDPAERIDHIFLAGKGTKWTCAKWSADLFMYGDGPQFPSDHRAISSEIEY
ncbi:MAG: hypothetical protein GXP49_14715 [Deltaproteobacteria bacterium]|nr:hypothetical protein [Deltaproteobacteria bacterium]